jgi:flagellar hook-length control protein FliK
MDTNLLTIENMLFTGATALAAPPANKPVPSANATQFSQAPDNTCPSSNTPESITADNISTNVQKEAKSKPRQDFNQMLRKTVKTESPQQNQKNMKSDKQYPTSELPSKVNPAKSTSTPEIPITLGALIKENAIKMEPKTCSQLAQLITNLKDGKSKPVTEQAAKSAEIKLLVIPDKSQLGIKTVLPDKSKDQPVLKTVVPDTFGDLHKTQTSLSNISKGISTTNTQPGKSKNNDEISASNSTVITTKASTNVENTKELISEALFNTKNNKAVTNEKNPLSSTSVVAGGAKNLLINSQKAGPNTLVDYGSKTNKPDQNLTDKSVIHINEKTSVLNTNFSQAQNKITGQDSQPIEIIPEKSTPNADFSQLQNKTNGQDSQPIGITPEKSTPNANITTDSKTTNSEIISESSNSNNKDTPNAGNKLSDDSTIRDLNIADVQIFKNQTKNHNSSTYNNNSNSDFEQISNQNNPLTYVTELSPNSAEGTKTVELPDQTSPNNISAGISKQILESIHSSSSQEGRNQQITVQLNPPELGKVFIKLQEQDSQITGLLEVSKTQTRIEIEQAIPQIVRSLQDSGIQIKRLDVMLFQGEQSEQGSLREQTMQNGWSQQQGSADSYTGGNNPDAGEINEWLINNKSYRNISDLQESLIDNGSINMLI